MAEWLTQHPGVKVLSRDRSRAYKSGITQGAPEALQVADRFQGVQNLAETLEKVLSSYGAQLKVIEQKQRQALTTTKMAVVSAKPTATVNAQAQTQATHQRRLGQQQEIRKLHEQQWSQIAIAQEVGVSVRTVRRFLRLPNLSTTPSRRQSFGRSLLDPDKQVLLEWWNGGIKQPRMLLTLLQQKGYTGSERTVTRYIGQLRSAQGLPTKRGYSAQSPTKVIAPHSPPLTARPC